MFIHICRILTTLIYRILEFIFTVLLLLGLNDVILVFEQGKIIMAINFGESGVGKVL